MIGNRIAHYEITGKLGAGGMGEVYRATDTKLNREVALKILPEQFAADSQRMARFEREAQVLASLNHPNIGAIYGIEETGDSKALVLELVEGPTLADRVQTGPLPIDETVAIGIQIAEALEAAHEKGVVHRDLKPANVKITPEGQVKVLDFGLARIPEPEPAASTPDLTASPTLTISATQAGVILGTAAYMSPEQARGRPVDRRTDIWAFGCVLYEMLCGAQAFEGDDVADTLAAVLRADIDLDELPAELPPGLRHLIGRCLTRDPRDRLAAIAEARYRLAHLDESPSQPASQKAGWPLSAGIIVGAAALITLAVLLAWSAAGPEPPTGGPLQRLQLELNPPVAIGTNNGSQAVISPDGSTLVYAGPPGMSLYMRPLAESESTLLVDTRGGRQPFFSPDGHWVGFMTINDVYKVSMTGGAAIPLARLEQPPRGGAWGPDGTIVVGLRAGPLVRLSAEGAAPVLVTGETWALAEEAHRWPDFLPDGRHVVFANTPLRGDPNESTLEVVDLESGSRRAVYRGGTYPRYSPSGHLLFVRRGDLYAIDFDADTLTVSGQPRKIFEDVTQDSASLGAQFGLSSNGTLVTLKGTLPEDRRTPSVFDLEDSTEVLVPVPVDQYRSPAVSPDGRQLAIQVGDFGDSEIFVIDLERGARRRLTFTAQEDLTPVWSPDSRQIAFSSAREGEYAIWVRSADGSGEARRVGPTSTLIQWLRSWSPDGRLIFFEHLGDSERQTSQVSVLELAPDGPGQTRVLLSGDFSVSGAALSPDGKWLCYQSSETSRQEIYVVSFPEQLGKRQVSVAGGILPQWSADGSRLFFVDPDRRLMVADVQPGNSVLEFSVPRDIARVSPRANIFDAHFSLFPDGRRLLALKSAETPGQTLDTSRLEVLINWTRLLE